MFSGAFIQISSCHASEFYVFHDTGLTFVDERRKHRKKNLEYSTVLWKFCQGLKGVLKPKSAIRRVADLLRISLPKYSCHAQYFLSNCHWKHGLIQTWYFSIWGSRSIKLLKLETREVHLHGHYVWGNRRTTEWREADRKSKMNGDEFLWHDGFGWHESSSSNNNKKWSRFA